MWVFAENTPTQILITAWVFLWVNFVWTNPRGCIWYDSLSLLVAYSDGSHLHFEVSPDGSSGQPRFWAQFPLLWSGCRLTHGVQQGRVGFEVRLERKLLTAQPDDHEVREPYGLRVGWSVADSSLLLGKNEVFLYLLSVDVLYLLKSFWFLLGFTSGEDELSFCYDGRGKKVSDRKEENFGEPFSEGDIIGCYAVSHVFSQLSQRSSDFSPIYTMFLCLCVMFAPAHTQSFSSDGAVELSFHKNGRFVGVAFSTDTSVLRGRALFPHVLCKSCSFKLLLDPAAQPWYPGPPGFTPLATLPPGQRVCSTSGPTSRAQCEVRVKFGFVFPIFLLLKAPPKDEIVVWRWIVMFSKNFLWKFEVNRVQMILYMKHLSHRKCSYGGKLLGVEWRM